MKHKVFVDGESGTTGLEIGERLKKRDDIELLKIAPELHRDINERKKMLNSADIVFLCLPDSAAVESASLIENENVKVIDASTAHRTNDGWVYGFPELNSDQSEKIKNSKRVAVPGCHATGFNAVVHPLVEGKILNKDYPLSATSVSGYSGGGKKLINSYEVERKDDPLLNSPRYYAFELHHKHIPEMVKINSLSFEPIFTPLVGNFYRGMLVSVPLCSRNLLKKADGGKFTAKDIHTYLSDYYKNKNFIKVMPFGGEGCLDGKFLGACGCNNTNVLKIFVFGHDDEILLISQLDNLGKGASGAAVQCMNLMLSLDETTSLI